MQFIVFNSFLLHFYTLILIIFGQSVHTEPRRNRCRVDIEVVDEKWAAERQHLNDSQSF